jgi:RNA polymerase sigma factor (sigma-70 family)
MAANDRITVLQHLRRVALRQDGAGLTDAQLLAEYLSRNEEAALAVLVRRHAAMVWGVCRRILRDYHDAEDAFQATFLVFVRKAASIASPELLANWLYGVAQQTALKARATTSKRRMRERQVTEMPESAAREQDLWDDLQPLLDQELARLSDKYRSAIVLCDLEGKTRKEAARQLGVPEGTVAARLARGRKMLASRLARRGLAVSGASLALLLAKNSASACAPTSMVAATIRAASLFAAGQASVAGLISVKAVALTEGVLKTMLLTKLKVATAFVLGVGLLGISWGLYPTRAAAPPQQQATPPQPPSTSAAVDKEGGNPTQDDQGRTRHRLPKGSAPVQVLVSLTKDGKLFVKSEHFLVKIQGPPPLAGLAPDPMPGVPQHGGRVLIRGLGPVPPHEPVESTYDLKDVQVFDTTGKKVGDKELAKLLKDETVAVAAFAPIDPLHLRILKEGTLVFILPLAPAGGLPLPDDNQAMAPEAGPRTVRFFFLQKRQTGLESSEQ